MSDTKAFHIGDILSIIDGSLVSPEHIGGVYNILGWMVDESLMTHSLPRVSRECKPQLRADFPDLAGITVPAGLNSEEKVLAFLETLYPTYGKTRHVRRLNREDHTAIDPITEIRMLRPDAAIVGLDGAALPAVNRAGQTLAHGLNDIGDSASDAAESLAKLNPLLEKQQAEERAAFDRIVSEENKRDDE